MGTVLGVELEVDSDDEWSYESDEDDNSAAKLKFSNRAPSSKRLTAGSAEPTVFGVNEHGVRVKPPKLTSHGKVVSKRRWRVMRTMRRAHVLGTVANRHDDVNT